jgi:hypothetical protein
MCVCGDEKEQNKSPTPTSIREAVNIHKRETRGTCVICVHAMKYFDKKNNNKRE